MENIPNFDITTFSSSLRKIFWNTLLITIEELGNNVSVNQDIPTNSSIMVFANNIWFSIDVIFSKKVINNI